MKIILYLLNLKKKANTTNLKIMLKILIKKLQIFVLVSIPLSSYSQNDVTRFLDVPVDGFKNEMIQKLRSKGYTLIPNSKDKLEGEFNGTNVILAINTNNNKVWRIIVAEANETDETNIKIKFNNLIRQFADNQRYFKQADSTITKFIIPKDEDISHEILIKKKRYEAVFYQKTLKYDSISNEKELLFAKDNLNEKESERLTELISESFKENLNCFNKPVWFMIQETGYDKYRIVIYYENEYNKANGEGL
jgi:hypothetical protein